MPEDAFESLCERLKIPKGLKGRTTLLRKAQAAHQANTILFLICAKDYLKDPSAKKLSGIYRLFITTPFRNEFSGTK